MDLTHQAFGGAVQRGPCDRAGREAGHRGLDVGPSGAVASSHAALTAIDLSTGKQVWRRTFAGLPDYLQLVDGVEVLTRGTPLTGSKVDTALVGIDPANGKQLWSYTGFSIPEPTAPATLGSSIYVTVVHHLKAFGRRIDVHTGKEVTSRRVDSIDAPVAGDDIVIWDDHEGEVTAFSTDLHRQLWQAEGAGGHGRRPDGGRRAGARRRRPEHDAAFYGYDPTSGASLWSSRLTFDDNQRQFWPTSSTMVIDHGDIGRRVGRQQRPRQLACAAAAVDHLAALATPRTI